MIGEAASALETALEKKLRELSQTVADETGYELYDVEYIKSSKTLRVYIADKETGSALIEDCVAVDRGFTPHVEEAEWIPDDFVLEVSSPGVYRKLKSEKHFKDALGEIILVDLSKSLEGDSLPKKLKGAKRVRGVLKECDNEKIILDADGTELEIGFASVKKANLDPDL